MNRRLDSDDALRTLLRQQLHTPPLDRERIWQRVLAERRRRQRRALRYAIVAAAGIVLAVVGTAIAVRRDVAAPVTTTASAAVPIIDDAIADLRAFKPANDVQRAIVAAGLEQAERSRARHLAARANLSNTGN